MGENSTIKLASSSWDSQEIIALEKVIESGIFSMDRCVQEFENQFAKFFGSNYAVMVNSGSSANLLMVAALFYKSENPLKAGDEVIVPAVSWSTTYFPLHQYGLKLVFVDIDLETLNYNLDALGEAISSRTKLIVAVNLLGNPNDFYRLTHLIGDKEITLIEDNCESMGASFNRQYTGTFGVMGSFSTYYSHHISTMEGGVVLTDNEEIYHILLSLRSHGWTRHLPDRNFVTGTKSSDWFEESFKFVLPGYNVRPIEMMGALGVTQLQKLPEIINNRRLNAQVFRDIMKDNSDLLIQSEIGESSWFGFSLIISPESKLNRRVLRSRLDRLQIEYRPIVAGNFLEHPVCGFLNHRVYGNLVNANYLNEHGLFIGNNGCDMSAQLARLAEI